MMSAVDLVRSRARVLHGSASEDLVGWSEAQVCTLLIASTGSGCPTGHYLNACTHYHLTH